MTSNLSNSRLSLSEFDVLYYMTLNPGAKLIELTKELSVDSVRLQSVLSSLESDHLIEKQKLTITKEGLAMLEPYRVKRAIILAAGMGSRMIPATNNTPKPMVKVTDKRIIETQLDALLSVGISDITIVRGYLGNVFDKLLDTYPMIKFIENPDYESTGAIISVDLASDLLEGAYIIEGDLFIGNHSVFRAYEYQTSYCGIQGNVTDDWHFYTDDASMITKLSFGETNDAHGRPHKFVGLMYWAPDEARLLQDDLKAFMNSSDNHQGFIESLPFSEQTSSYNIRVRNIALDDVIELDTHEELQTLRNRLAKKTL